MDRAPFLQSIPGLQHSLRQIDPALDDLVIKAERRNPWFIGKFSRTALDAIVNTFLDPVACAHWLGKYAWPKSTGKRIGLILAGNIPLVGFHDVFCVLAAGHQAVIKMSDKDSMLLPYVLEKWATVYPDIKHEIQIVDKLTQIDAVIATGSHNSSRYFEYYFKNYPHLFRQNRNGVALLTGKESEAELISLASDIFMYFGLGCRNVSKIFVPAGYDFRDWPAAIAEWAWMADHNKYKNNLDYNQAIFLINRIPHIGFGHLILKEDDAVASRIGCLHYTYFSEIGEVVQQVDDLRDQIQCIVSQDPFGHWDHIRPGQSQQPALHQYADGVDTMEFLLNL